VGRGVSGQRYLILHVPRPSILAPFSGYNHCMTPIFWAALLLVLGLMLVMTEIFIPSGGIIGFLSFSSIIAAIVLAFLQGGGNTGMVFLLIACVAVPGTIAAAFRILPGTPMGKRLLPSIPTTEEVMPDDESRRRLRGLVGKIGRAKSMMLPSGAVEIEGRIVDAVSQGVPIEPGQPVRVIEVHGMMVVVQPLDDVPASQRDPNDVLAQPIESLGIDPFEEPLV
jgi:membrane-bound ClpP family serine protease